MRLFVVLLYGEETIENSEKEDPVDRMMMITHDIFFGDVLSDQSSLTGPSDPWGCQGQDTCTTASSSSLLLHANSRESSRLFVWQ